MILSCPFCRVRVQGDASDCRACGRRMARACPYCEEKISVTATLCKYCGEAVEPEPRSAEPAAARTSAPETPPPAPEPDVQFVDEVKYCAWEDRSKRGIFSRWWSTWKELQFDPEGFWRRLPTEGGHRPVHGYVWFLQAQMLLLLLPFAAVLGVAVGIHHDVAPAVYLVGAGAYLALFPLMYLLVVLSNYVGALFWHIVLRIAGGRGTFETTLRTAGYMSGTAVWGLIPFVGGMVHLVMLVIQQFHAFRTVHGLSTGRAVAAILAPFAISLALTAALVAILVAAVVSGAPPQSC